MKTPFTRIIILVSIMLASFVGQLPQIAKAQGDTPVVTPGDDGDEVEISITIGERGGEPGTPPGNGEGGGTGGGVSNPVLPAPPPAEPVDPNVITPYDPDTGPIAGSGTPIEILKCVAQADGSYADLEMIYAGGTWWVNRTFPVDAATCIAPPSTELVEPCAPTAANGTGALTFECTGDANTAFAWKVKATAKSECPVNRVLRTPYPRTLVSMDTQFVLKNDKWGTGGESGNWSNAVAIPGLVENDGRPTGDNQYKDVSIGVRSFRLNSGSKWFGATVNKPAWTFADDTTRALKYTKKQKGPIAVFAFETSSYYQPEKGRAFDFDRELPSSEYNLPAYPVGIVTECGHQWSMKWKISAHDDFCDGAAAGDDTACQRAGGTWRTRYKWEDKSHAWTSINLKKYGLPNPWANITVATAGGVFQNVTYWDQPSGGIWVPVIEVQSILVRECVYKGTCQSPRTP